MAVVIVTVTPNAALDRTLIVPSFQVGHRHRASSASTSAGGKGINVARALKRLGIPVVCTGLAGGRAGVQIVERLTGEGLLNDLVRIQDESRTSTAVIDPTSTVSTEINEWGPELDESEVAMLREKLVYLSQGADSVVFCGSLPRGVEDGLYADLIRSVARLSVPTVLDADGEPLRLGVQAGPTVVSPNVNEAEQLVGHEFAGSADIAAGLDEVAAFGPKNVLITVPDGCYALLREDREELRLRARVSPIDAVSTIGAGDALLAGYLAARVLGKAAGDSLRQGVATGAASVLEAGAGRFDTKEIARIAADVTIEEWA
ncbi:MAG: 1-phosphofructokinase family hexose kinase [Actinomycetia bacterium]|nr:1-phosphofructokinase family hexose kinase [Actinomycetes bacterium]